MGAAAAAGAHYPGAGKASVLGPGVLTPGAAAPAERQRLTPWLTIARAGEGWAAAALRSLGGKLHRRAHHGHTGGGEAAGALWCWATSPAV